MRFPVPQLAILVLLVHTALGCCLHFAHECEAGCGESVVAPANECPCESPDHEDHSGLQKQPGDGIHSEGDHHRHERDCDGIHCTFVRSDRSLGDYKGRSADATPLWWGDSLQRGNRIYVPLLRAHDCPSPHSRPAVRSHLLLSVLLI
jgi:hypothetical protein